MKILEILAQETGGRVFRTGKREIKEKRFTDGLVGAVKPRHKKPEQPKSQPPQKSVNDIYLENLKAVNELHDFLNERFFESTLSKIVLTLQLDPKGKTYGHYTCYEAWQSGDGQKSPEINISANYLDRPPVETIATLLHEMCHQYAGQHKINDCSRSGTYHNKQFKDIAEKHGLEVEKTKNGWNSTKLTDHAKSVVAPMIDKLFSIKRIVPTNGGATKTSSTRKYMCPDCELTVRATKEVYIKCGDCDVTMQEV